MFIKAAGYETVKLHSQNNPNSYWYSFDFEGRNSLYALEHPFGIGLQLPLGGDLAQPIFKIQSYNHVLLQA